MTFHIYPPTLVINIPISIAYFPANSEIPKVVDSQDIKSCKWFINDIEQINIPHQETKEEKKQSSFITKLFGNNNNKEEVVNQFIPKIEHLNGKLKVQAEIKNIKNGPKGGIIELIVQEPIITHPKRSVYEFHQKSDPNYHSIDIISYNIMADCYTQAFRYNTPFHALYRPYRKHLMDNYILDYDGDIICLQEYEPNFKELLVSLNEKGFSNTPVITSSYYTPKDTKTPRYQPPDQCITFYKTSKFKLIEEKVVDFNMISNTDYLLNESQITHLNSNPVTKHYLAEVMKTGHHNRFSFLHLKDIRNNQEILVINVHLYWGAPTNEANYCLQVIQVYILTLLIQAFQEKHANSNNIPIILCGDLNNEPHHPANTFLRDGVYNLNYETDIFTFRHPFLFKSVYGSHPNEEPSFTTATKSYQKCIDFIYICNGKRKDQGKESDSSLEMKSFVEIGNHYHATLPSITEPSDHILLKSTLSWRKPQIERIEDLSLIDKCYRAAGILPYTYHQGKLKFLLCCEPKSLRNIIYQNGMDKMFLACGGRIESGENSIQTAIREFNEETGYIFKDKLDGFREKITNQPKFFNNRTNFMLFTMEIDYDETISETYAKLDKSDKVTFPDTPALLFEWVDEQLLSAHPQNLVFKRENQEVAEFASFFAEMLPMYSKIFSNNNNN